MVEYLLKDICQREIEGILLVATEMGEPVYLKKAFRKFLKENGFVITETKGKRMICGKDIDWQPEKIFSRIGGNFG